MASWAVPGLGMFNESYYIFSVGNIKPIWTEEFPSCWKVCAVMCSRSAILDTVVYYCIGTTVWGCASAVASNVVPGKHCLVLHIALETAGLG